MNYSFLAPRKISTSTRLSSRRYCPRRNSVYHFPSENFIQRKNTEVLAYPFIRITIQNKNYKYRFVESQRVTAESRAYMLGRLEEFRKNLSKSGWDGYSAVPIIEECIARAKEIILKTDSEILNHWNIFPSPRGTVSFEFKYKEIGAVSIGIEDFSFAARNKSGEKLKGKYLYSEKDPIGVLNEITRSLGY